jgi:hypothetical protein
MTLYNDCNISLGIKKFLLMCHVQKQREIENRVIFNEFSSIFDLITFHFS